MTAFTPELIERLAEAIHERFRRSQAGRRDPADPAMAAWADLTGTLRDSNRSQAADIPAKLVAVRCVAVPDDGQLPFAFTPEELDLLSELEHQRWAAERRASGWTLGPGRDPQRRVTPYLVPYQDLPEDIRELDRQAVAAIPELLRMVGLAIRRTG